MIQGQNYPLEVIARPEFAPVRREFNNYVHNLRQAAWETAAQGSTTQKEQEARYQALVEDLPEVKRLEEMRTEVRKRRQDDASAIKRQIGKVSHKKLRTLILESDLGDLEVDVLKALALHDAFIQNAAAHARQITFELCNGCSAYQDEVPFGTASFKQRWNQITAYDAEGQPLCRWGVDAEGVAYVVKRWDWI